MLIPPYGGVLINRIVPDEQWREPIAGAGRKAMVLSHDDLIHLFNIASGCYSPLTGFMTEQEYQQVIHQNKLPLGLDWTIPILLHVETLRADELSPGTTLVLLAADLKAIGTITIESVFSVDKEAYCTRVFGTTSSEHPGVQDVSRKSGLCVGGPVSVAASGLPDLRYYRRPVENRAWLESTRGKSFTAFSTRNVCHLGHEYLHTLALEVTDVLGINVITGAQVKGSFLPDVIFDTYEHLINHYYPAGRVFLNNLRIPPIYGGPKEAFLQATILQNLGFTHFIVGRDHAGIGSFYARYASQQIFEQLTALAIQIMPISEPRFCSVCQRISTERSCRHRDQEIRELNGKDVRRFLLEKRYNELEKLLPAGLRSFLIEMFEERVDIKESTLQLKGARPILYE